MRSISDEICLMDVKMSRKNVVIKQSKMLAHRNPSNRVSENYRRTSKLNAYEYSDTIKKIGKLILIYRGTYERKIYI